MKQYIPKSVVIAEIDNLLDKGKYHEEYDCAYRDGNNSALYALKGKIDTLEVKEVDLEKELQGLNKEIIDDNGFFNPLDIAKHFFELGLKVNKEEDV